MTQLCYLVGGPSLKMIILPQQKKKNSLFRASFQGLVLVLTFLFTITDAAPRYMRHSDVVKSSFIGGIGDTLTSVLAPGLGNILPSGLGQISGLITSIGGEGASEECKNIALQCLKPSGAIGCGELITGCAFEKFLGPSAEPVYSDIGEIDVEDAIRTMALAGQFPTVSVLVKRIMSKCAAYLPDKWMAVVENFNPIATKETPEHKFICSIFTGLPVSRYTDTTKINAECEYPEVNYNCKQNKGNTALNDYFGAYFNFVEGQQLPYYRPGESTVLNLLAHDVQIERSVYPRISIAECMAHKDRFKCVAAGLLAEACEDSCAEAHCVWNQIKDEEDCSDSFTKNAVFTASTRKCQYMAASLGLMARPRSCEYLGTSYSNNVEKILFLVTLIITFISF